MGGVEGVEKEGAAWRGEREEGREGSVVSGGLSECAWLCAWLLLWLLLAVTHAPWRSSASNSAVTPSSAKLCGSTAQPLAPAAPPTSSREAS